MAILTKEPSAGSWVLGDALRNAPRGFLEEADPLIPAPLDGRGDG